MIFVLQVCGRVGDQSQPASPPECGPQPAAAAAQNSSGEPRLRKSVSFKGVKETSQVLWTP